jgi:hypothetical protein
MASPSDSRRKFLRGGTAVLVAVPLSQRVATAQEQKKVDESSPQAKTVHYSHDATKVKDPKRQKDQFCSNCQLFLTDKKEGWGPCALFGSQLVAAKGWCNAWVKKA